MGILSLCEQGAAELISSDALLFEARRNPNPARKEYALVALSRAKQFIALNAKIEQRAVDLNNSGFGPLDALHLASAEESPADFFCTCDDRLLKRAKSFPGLKIRVMSPIELAEEIEK